MSESNIQREIMLALSAGGVTIWRNNTAMAWVGEVSRRRDGAILISGPRPLHAGLCKGSSDLIGLRSVTITPDMVGSKIAQFVAIEVKDERGRVTKEQRNFLDHVQEAGGLAGVARCPDDALAITKVHGNP